jgi:hypothetical protein
MRSDIFCNFTSHKRNTKLQTESQHTKPCTKVSLLHSRYLRLEFELSALQIGPIFTHISAVTFTSSQCFTSLLALGICCGYPSLCATLIAVACTQFQKLNAAILDIRQEYIMPRQGQGNEQNHKTANCNLQDKLNACIRHHQEIMAWVHYELRNILMLLRVENKYL